MGWRCLGRSPLARILSLFRLCIRQSLNVHRATRPNICQSPVETKKKMESAKHRQKPIKLWNDATECMWVSICCMSASVATKRDALSEHLHSLNNICAAHGISHTFISIESILQYRTGHTWITEKYLQKKFPRTFLLRPKMCAIHVTRYLLLHALCM